MKFVVLFTPKKVPDSITAEAQLQMVKASLKMIRELTASGTIDCVYAYPEPGNGFAVVNVDSHEQLHRLMLNFPEGPFVHLEAKPLVDIEDTYANLISVIQPS